MNKIKQKIIEKEILGEKNYIVLYLDNSNMNLKPSEWEAIRMVLNKKDISIKSFQVDVDNNITEGTPIGTTTPQYLNIGNRVINFVLEGTAK